MAFEDDEIVRVADKDLRTYLGQCDKKFSKYPQVTLSFGETFAEKGRSIISILGAIGIKIHKENINNVSGNLKFKSVEDNVLNQKTGKRENKTFFQVKLDKIKDLKITPVEDYVYCDLSEAKIAKDDFFKNELKIGENSLDFYLGQCNLDFQCYDQLILSTTEENIETLKYIIKMLNPLGIEIDEEYINKDTIVFRVIEKERINPRTGRKERKKFYRVGITKVPDLFMYTNPRDAIKVNDE